MNFNPDVSFRPILPSN